MICRFNSSCQIQFLKLNRFEMNSLRLLISAIVLTGGSIGFLPRLAQSATLKEMTQVQSVLQEQGSLQPMQQEHLFSGEAGQIVTISLNSGEFDTYLTLLDPSGREIAANDDYARSLNSSLVVTLPENGQYKVLARSFSGQGGSYTISVKPATPFDQAYSRGVRLFSEGNLEEAATALSEAIQIEPNQPAPYLDRAEVAYAQGNLSLAISNYQQAADLYEKAGNSDAANQIRHQLAVLQTQSAL